MTTTHVAGCPLCEAPGGRVVFEAPAFRVVRAAEEGFPAFYRVVWKDHVAEWSDLAPEDRRLCMDAVVAVEQCLREALAPTKINIAALGNMVPHLHWHVIARFDWDPRFPGSVWAEVQREREPKREAAIERRLPALEQTMAERLATR
ncbi:HIT family protein [Variovorax soli]|uniref:Diadenosine tetraphosphate (Ap4A) HIT family hydrolase n=1 Tax=Variovorax soli TaxID=376815 RepID=A0ABU1NFW2_9BURK|nr:HIT family protein [Variovorax soli]MDR6537357.1 diadenosine tetraphosphate (Ap4A) HIT family hydrolase [Variovorax soli]